MTLDSDGVNFVSRTARNNGVSARVSLLDNITPLPAGTISVSGGGSVMEAFFQSQPYYSGQDLYYLCAKFELSDAEKLYYCTCIRANKYKYSYGRQANRTLRTLLIPAWDDLPVWVKEARVNVYDNADEAAKIPKCPIQLLEKNWQPFKLSDLFTLKKGKRLTKASMSKGNTPFIGLIDSNNGVSGFVGQAPIHQGNTITVNYNGSVAEAFYQISPFWASDDVNVLYPKFEMRPAIALFIITVIKKEKYRYNYGRKWHLERMSSTSICLPTNNLNEPDWVFMENFIKSLPFSSQI